MRIVLLAAAAVCLSGCATLTTMDLDRDDSGALRYERSHDLEAAVDSLAKPVLASGETPGILVGVLTPDGQTRYFSYGVADKDTGAPIEPDTLFQVGSISKGFLSDLVAVLVDRGELHWDDTLEQLLPPGTPLSPDARKITLLQLATHTSGLPREPMVFQTFEYLVQYTFTGKNFYRHFTAAFALDYLKDFEAPKDREMRYSNIGYGILGYVVEIKTGHTLDELMARYITSPLGLYSTGYEPQLLPGYAERAHGYTGDQPFFMARGSPTPDMQFTELMKGSAALYSDARDLLSYAAANLKDDGDHLTHVMQQNLQAQMVGTEDVPTMGWFVDDIDGEEITYQQGLVAGYSSYLGLDRRHHTAVVVLQNSFNWHYRIGHPLLLRLAKAAEMSAAPDSSTAPPAGH
ncbi:MAG TPA: serine hydrolase domain-containing protein [Gammaproteobacteria bacterium]|nr:serine hydrolase domain-containing protein [Gammaproteobacteria bacterium]